MTGTWEFLPLLCTRHWDSVIHLGGATEISFTLTCHIVITIIAKFEEVAQTAYTVIHISALLLIKLHISILH